MRSIRRQRPLLGTFVEIGVQPPWSRRSPPDCPFTAAFASIAQIHRLLSFQDPDSDLSRLNRAGGEPVALHPLSLRVLRLARAMTFASGGLFNCTVGGTLVRRGVLPDHDGTPTLDRGDAHDIVCNSRTAQLRRPLRITLDGIAKGYAVDLAITALRRCGIVNGWINAGGDLRVFGTMTLPVHRREADGHLAPLGNLCNAALASSHASAAHDMDFPAVIVPGATNACAHPGVWSVIARHTWRADALTKVAALAPAANRNAIIQRLGGLLVYPASLKDVAA